MLDKTRTRTRLRNMQWEFTPDANGNHSNEIAILACLMDVRDELQKLNGLLRCPNFLSIPRLLRGIQTNTTRRKRAKK